MNLLTQNSKMKKTSLKVGRQFITTPLVSSGIAGKSSEAIINDSFEAYTLTNNDIADTTIVAAYVNQYQQKTDGSGNIGEFAKFQDGASSLFVKNTSLKDTTIQVQYLSEKGETSATNRGALIKVFTNIDNAITWLKFNVENKRK